MITYNKLYSKLCSYENLLSAFNKAKKGKTKMYYVISFEEDLENNIRLLQKELIEHTYLPKPLKKFIIRDPKTRTIHASIFRDRIVHHAIVNILQPIYEKIFIYDSFASRKDKGNHEGVKRFEEFVRKVSHNGKLIKKPFDNNSIQGYVLKADIRKYFDSMNHEVLINILKKKISDKEVIDLIRKVLNNFNIQEGVGLPLGNYTSQFFANVYLNELDYYIKHILKAKYYIRYVDDFVILHPNKKRLEYSMKHIKLFLPCLKIQLHPEKSSIIPLRNGVNFLGYRVFFHHRLLRERNLKTFKKKLEANIELYKNQEITLERLNCRIQGWTGHAKFANTFTLRNNILAKVKLVTT
jgi:retron-type reverse transcriptase